jgi:hypothetical protein
MKLKILIGALFATLLLLPSCHGGIHRTESSPPLPSATPTGASTLPEAAPALKITIEDGSGKVLYVLKKKEGKYRILDDREQAIGEVKIEADRVKIKDKSDRVLWKIKKKDGGCKLTTDSDAELYRIKGAGGDYKLKDSKDIEVARIKNKGNYLEISGMGSGKVKSEGDGVAIEDGKGTVLFSIKRGLKKEEGCFLGLTSLEPLQRVGLVLFYKEIK